MLYRGSVSAKKSRKADELPNAQLALQTVQAYEVENSPVAVHAYEVETSPVAGAYEVDNNPVAGARGQVDMF
jgi:hypothetical protein